MNDTVELTFVGGGPRDGQTVVVPRACTCGTPIDGKVMHVEGALGYLIVVARGQAIYMPAVALLLERGERL